MQLEEILESAGHHIVGVVQDLASLNRVNAAPEVALVDLNLRDGLTGMKIAHELSEKHGTKIVYVTANPDQLDDVCRTAVGILQKPFSGNTVLDAVAFAHSDSSGPVPEGLDSLDRVAQSLALRMAPPDGSGKDTLN